MSLSRAANSVQDKLNVSLHFFLEINFPGLERSVDQLGGVDVTAPVTATYNNAKFVQGQTYHLAGKDLANYFLADDQHENALTREKQELSTVMAMLKKATSLKTLYNQQFL